MSSKLRAHIAVALKRLHKTTLARLTAKDWLEREAAIGEVADVVIDALGAFEIKEKPAIIPPAMSNRVTKGEA